MRHILVLTAPYYIQHITKKGCLSSEKASASPEAAIMAKTNEAVSEKAAEDLYFAVEEAKQWIEVSLV